MAAGSVIGVDLGGTKLLAGALDGDLDVHHRAHRTARGLEQAELLECIVDAVGEAVRAAHQPVHGVGLGIPSLVDRTRGTSAHSVHLPLRGVPVREVMAQRLRLPVWVDNDATAAMLAEWRLGAAVGARHAVLVALGTGIGGGLVVEGTLVRGARGMAGELGHVVVDPAGPACGPGCPNRGCLEALASGTALAREALGLAGEHPRSALGRAVADGKQVTGALATQLARDGDPAAVEAVGRIGRWLGVGIAGLVNTFDPEVVVVGGGLVAAGDLLLAPARKALARHGLPPLGELVPVVPARFGPESGMVGAAALAWEGLGRLPGGSDLLAPEDASAALLRDGRA
ncbi:MAG TPA: ROK family protein [Solirubrobacteraceae bacterium]|nr:ROK family protein [Solirubrobacteraceae bacterium]